MFGRDRLLGAHMMGACTSPNPMSSTLMTLSLCQSLASSSLLVVAISYAISMAFSRFARRISFCSADMIWRQRGHASITIRTAGFQCGNSLATKLFLNTWMPHEADWAGRANRSEYEEGYYTRQAVDRPRRP